MRMERGALADWGTILMAGCAILMTGLVVQQKLVSVSDNSLEDREVDDWDDYISGGHRIGPEHAAVVIVEFGDYECPFCKQLEPSLRTVLDEYPTEVSLIYRHLPLAIHANAYPAARMTECAADQGAFELAHRLMYDLETIHDIDPDEFGVAIGIPDLPSFVRCANDTEPVPRIEWDLAAAERLNIMSTPTVVVNGLRLARTPSLGRLRALVSTELEAR